MCGIFGLMVPNLAGVRLEAAIREMFLQSESRGKEAAGLALRAGGRLWVYKRPVAASQMIVEPEYREFLRTALDGVKEGPAIVIGHSRLVTNGQQGRTENNQPVAKGGLVGVHNGIVVNDNDLWKSHPELKRETEVDTEVILALVDEGLARTGSATNAISQAFAALEGSASIALLFEQFEGLALATNTGSLYYVNNKAERTLAFSSEHFILSSALKRLDQKFGFAESQILQLRAGRGLLVDPTQGGAAEFELNGKASSQAPFNFARAPATRVDYLARDEEWLQKLVRCSKCILPETMPFIDFDSEGVCNFCRNYRLSQSKGKAALEAVLTKYRRNDGRPDCVLAFSGGRDSSYGLHYLKTELGMNPVAYTYDWGMVTDIARRNQAKICGKLGIEHIIISADIREKRRNIRSNVEAWLKRPELGMIPLFMAGDKQYFYYADQVRKRVGCDLVVLCGNSLEATGFKSGFCGVNERNRRIYNVPLASKAKLVWYYLRNFAQSPGYINASLADTMFAFFSSYIMKHDFLWLFQYIPWNEGEIDSTLQENYQWEVAQDTDVTWRIGDGTAAFYNYIYFSVAGFSEHDTFLSNQIREGSITREEALRKSAKCNLPRLPSMADYAHKIGLDLDQVMSVVQAMPRLYDPRHKPAMRRI